MPRERFLFSQLDDRRETEKTVSMHAHGWGIIASVAMVNQAQCYTFEIQLENKNWKSHRLSRDLTNFSYLVNVIVWSG